MDSIGGSIHKQMTVVYVAFHRQNFYVVLLTDLVMGSHPTVQHHGVSRPKFSNSIIHAFLKMSNQQSRILCFAPARQLYIVSSLLEQIGCDLSRFLEIRADFLHLWLRKVGTTRCSFEGGKTGSNFWATENGGLFGRDPGCDQVGLHAFCSPAPLGCSVSIILSGACFVNHKK